MDKVISVFYEAVKILSKVFAIWQFGGDKFDYDYNTDFNGENGLKKNFEDILDVLKS